MTGLFIFLFICDLEAYSQIPTPLPAAVTSSTEKSKTDDGKATQDAQTAQTQKPEPDIWHREELTGDWGGVRTRLKNKGVETSFKVDQFYQGVAAGGVQTDSVYTGKFTTDLKLDFGKLAGWKFWSADIQTQVRFGGNAVLKAGALNTVNTAEIVPASDGTVFSVTAVNVTKLFPLDLQKGDLIAVSIGRYNLLDAIDEHFFAGSGTDRFFNIAQIGPLTVLRQVPLISNGATFAWVKGGEPRFTFALVDPNDHSLDPGISDLFADGVSFVPTFNLPTKYHDKTGEHSFGFAITTKQFTPFDDIRQIIIPGPPLVPLEGKRASWSINYTFRQYIVERAKKDGWGFFTQASVADKKTSPVTTFVTVGLGGNGLFKGRTRDDFGIAYSFTDASKDLKDFIDPRGVGRLVGEHEFEVFYNFHLTPWARLTGDLQIIRGVRGSAQPAVVPGLRFEMRF